MEIQKLSQAEASTAYNTKKTFLELNNNQTILL
jgi:hypothetical protein